MNRRGRRDLSKSPIKRNGSVNIIMTFNWADNPLQVLKRKNRTELNGRGESEQGLSGYNSLTN